ncbi:MAG: tRNA (guanine-N(7)-)-methyltransferase [Chlamydiae bacterium]|nr:tRNA (guanine-N(7)-)-methyltransferase [Chlamydiota bacterium]
MKPKDLKPPFKWGEQYTTIQDKIFYTFEPFGKETLHFEFPGWDHPDVFGNDQPVKIEYCSGHGHWIAHQALTDPEVNWVAVEKLFVRLRKIWSKMKNYSLNNLFSVCGEAYDITKRYIPSASVTEVYVNFPDPWPKKKHAKYRLIQPAFIEEIYRILKPEGTITLVTDDENYSIQMMEVLNSQPGFISCYPEPYFCTSREGYGNSFFEDLWREKGKGIRYLLYQKVEVTYDL